MASLRKRGTYWYARFYDSSRSPKRKQIPLRVTRKRIARKKLAELEEMYEAGDFDPWTDSSDRGRLSAPEAVERFLDAKAGTVRERTLGTYRQQLEAWLRTLPPGLMLHTARAKHIRPYVLADGVSNATQRKRYRHLQAFFNWHDDKGTISDNPMAGVVKPKAKKKQPAFLSPDELDRLLQCIDVHAETVETPHSGPPDVAWLKHVIRVAVCTGLRRGELMNLRWRDIDLSQRLLTVRNRDGFTTKSGHERTVPLRSDALDTLHALHAERSPDPTDPVFIDRTGAAVKPNRATRRFKFFVRKAMLKDREDLSFHSLRHTCGAWLASGGVPLRVVQEILGHSSINVTEIYSHLQPDVMGDAMERAFNR